MTSVNVHYLNGDITRLDECPTIGSIMTQVAMKHECFASDIKVVCSESGKDLTKLYSQVPPTEVSVVLQQAKHRPRVEDLDLTIFLHAEHGDIATCKRAVKKLMGQGYQGSDYCNIFNRILQNNDPSSWTPKMLRTLVRTGIQNDTVLHEYCSDNKEAVEKLLAARVSPNGGDMEGMRPLMYACSAGNVEIVELLLSKQASVNLEDRKGNDALFFVCSEKHDEIVDLLLAPRAQEETREPDSDDEEIKKIEDLRFKSSAAAMNNLDAIMHYQFVMEKIKYARNMSEAERMELLTEMFAAEQRVNKAEKECNHARSAFLGVSVGDDSEMSDEESSDSVDASPAKKQKKRNDEANSAQSSNVVHEAQEQAPCQSVITNEKIQEHANDTLCQDRSTTQHADGALHQDDALHGQPRAIAERKLARDEP